MKDWSLIAITYAMINEKRDMTEIIEKFMIKRERKVAISVPICSVPIGVLFTLKGFDSMSCRSV